MEKFNLENFPTSASAKKMLSYVSDGFYDRSYVGKWLFQVMGQEYDVVQKIVEEMPSQFFPETATWGLMYHEIKWGLPICPGLPYEERRSRIYQKRDYRAPMTPYLMERYLADATGIEVHIADINDPGEYGFAAPHPNIFKVYFVSEQTLDSKFIHQIIDQIKQSHTSYKLNDRMEVELDNRDQEKIILSRVHFAMDIFFWILSNDAADIQKKRYSLMLGLKHSMYIFNTMEQIKRHMEAISAKIHTKELQRLNVKVMHFLHVDELKKLSDKTSNIKVHMNLQVKFYAGNEQIDVNITTKTPDYWLLDGSVKLDGSRRLNSIYKKEEIE